MPLQEVSRKMSEFIVVFMARLPTRDGDTEYRAV